MYFVYLKKGNTAYINREHNSKYRNYAVKISLAFTYALKISLAFTLN